MPAKCYSHCLVTYNPRAPAAIEEFKKIRRVLIKHSEFWIISMEQQGTDNAHVHAYLRFNVPKSRQNIRPLFLKPTILNMCLKGHPDFQEKEEYDIGLKINYLDKSEHYEKYYIGYCSKEEGENYPLHRKLDENETQIQSSIPDDYVKECFQYYDSKKEDVEKEKENRKYKGNLRKQNFYQTVISKIETDTRLTLGRPTSFKKAINYLVREDKVTFFGLPKYLINECYIFYLTQYCDEDSEFDTWLSHKIHYAEHHQDLGVN